ncbi:ATP-binding protein [Haloarcula marina]|uniref:ATP-binding protein n=1 Tax=Haloarcula marina TaxID=2961574 RepID=UPI0020B8239F|nr:ATP-binding protein [Halomicroarcula marina]
MARSPPTDSTLPVPAEDADTYIRIQPAEDSLDPAGVEAQIRRLHRLVTPAKTGWLARLRDSAEPPTIEWLLVGDETGGAYYVTTDHQETLSALESTLRALFPDSYAFERVHEPRAGVLGDLVTPFPSETTAAAVSYERETAHPKDWQTPLTPFESFYRDDSDDRTHRIPLAGVIETIANSPVTIAFQILIQPKADWSAELADRKLAIATGEDTLGGSIANAVFGSPDPDDQLLLADDERRLTELDERDPRCSFDVNVRVVVAPESSTDDPTTTDHLPKTIADELSTAFAHLSRTTHDITGRVSTGSDVERIREHLEEGTFLSASPRLSDRLPWSSVRHPTLVVDATELGGLCILDGAGLTAAGRRCLDATPTDRQSLSQPPESQLTQYRTTGLPIGYPLTQDNTPDPDPLALPPELQSLHLAWFGKTGSGKSTSLINAILDNHEATDGADILIDPKGDGMPLEYMCAHYERYGTLENVLYFDCATLLPAFSFFDIRDELEEGISRTSAVEDRVDHYIEILIQLMGRDRFEQAVRSPDIIRYVTKAMFDPVSGSDAFSHRDLHSAVQEMHDRNTAPPVSDGDLERMLAGVVANSARTFDELMQGVANRIEKVPVNPRLARIFNHVPDRTDSDDPHFDLREYLDEDVVIIFDTGGLRSESQRALALLILSNLWSALKRRASDVPHQRGAHAESQDDEDEPTDMDRPLVNVYVEEAASIAVSSLLSELLSQSRSFDCALTLAMQFPAQLQETSNRAYREVLNNVSTIVTGNVAVDDQLATRLATDEMGVRKVGNRLRALRRGQWFVSLPAGFDEDEPAPFLVRSLTPPAGHPASTTPARRRGFQRATQRIEARMKEQVALRLVEPNPAETGDTEEETEPPQRVDSALPYTNRLPPTVIYDASIHSLACCECESRYDPDGPGMCRAIECCSILDETDPDDIPICEVNLKLTPGEREETEFSDRQLMFVQAVYNAQQLRYTPPEYDLLHDSMLRLQEYLDIQSDAIRDLLDAGVLTHDADRPHKLYTVTPAGRSLIGEHYRKGVDYGHGKGDLEETSEHVLAVEVGRRYLEAEYGDDPESPVEEVIPYFELDERDRSAVPAASAMGGSENELSEAASEYDRHRIDVVGLDGDGRIRITLEAERINHDVRRAVPEDFDKMAACDPDEAIWLAMSHAEAHRILDALNDPLEGAPRIEKTYAKSTPANQFRLDTPGCTGMYTVEQVRDMVDEHSA